MNASPARRLWPAAALLAGCCGGASPYDRVDCAHPETEAEIVALVKDARARGVQLRVRGSRHSVQPAIFTDAPDTPAHVNVQLDRYARVLEWDDAKMQVTVQAGCHLGKDPNNPLSTKENGLLRQMHARGWALPDLGGITHQTVGGFLSTGSAGGSTVYDVAEAIVRLRLVDGCGNVHELAPNPADPDDEATNPFYAAGVSMGLLGVLSTVTFQCMPAFNVIGSQATTEVGKSTPDLFADGAAGLGAFLAATPYNRLLWWPQRGVEKLQVWQARRTTTADDAVTHKDGKFEAQPFRILPRIAGSTEPAQAVIHAYYNALDYGDTPYGRTQEKAVALFMNAFLAEENVRFWDLWYRGIPMDDAIDDQLMPTEFTELFIDLARAAEVMRALREFYAGDDGMGRVWANANEIYAGRRSKFWLSPNYGRDSVRVDLFWFKARGQEPPDRRFYPQYWELLRPFDFRFHWGKYLSDPTSSTGVAYRRRQFPMWDRFMEVRKRMDPDGVFLTSYWRRHLGLEAK